MWSSWRCQLCCLLLVVVVSVAGLLCQVGDLLARHGLVGRPATSLNLSAYLPAGQFQVEPVVEPDRLLQFQVCNGFANQRLSLTYGLLLAAMTNRTAVLPDLIPSGIQYTLHTVMAGVANAYSFESIYSKERFYARLAKTGIRIVSKSSVQNLGKFVNATVQNTLNAAEWLTTEYGGVPYLSIDCPLFRLPASYMVEHEDTVWDILDALWPSAHLMPVLNSALDKLKSLSPAGNYNFLHLRAENDWVAHCDRWSNIPDGVIRDNCMNNTYTVDLALGSKHFPTQIPLYVASFWTDVEASASNLIFARLKEAGYSVYTQKDIMTNITDMPRETLALVEFYLALQSERFIGNSVSTFSAMLIYERRYAGLWAAYYNTGNIPLAQMLPLDKLPWVFTYNSWSSKYDYMLKAALRSALKHGGLKPYCLFSGNTSSAIYNFLVSSNVVMMSHDHVWAEQLVEHARPFMIQHLAHSHLYDSAGALVGGFQRIDLPVLPALDQYDHVLFTDADVFFNKRFTLIDFGTPLPSSVGMTWEMQDRFPFNDGVMLMNITELRDSHDRFLAFILNNTQGLMFPGYGPVDQGAYNQFYEASVRQHEISQRWNAKPYLAVVPDYSIVHFHGPKPHDYLLWAETGTCNFDNLCLDAFTNSLCTYIEQWFPYVSEEDEAQRIYKACASKQSGQMLPGQLAQMAQTSPVAMPIGQFQPLDGSPPPPPPSPHPPMSSQPLEIGGASPTPVPASQLSNQDASPAPVPVPQLGNLDASPAPVPVTQLGNLDASPAPVPVPQLGNLDASPEPVPDASVSPLPVATPPPDSVGSPALPVPAPPP